MKKKCLGKVSIIIPTYNRGRLIKRSIDSVLSQSYKNIEVIVVDDGSNDNTEEVVKGINDKRLKYIKLEGNHGACYARNVGIRKSSGDFIAFQDSDDVFDKYKMEKQLNNLIKCKSDLDFSSIIVHFDSNSKASTVIPNGELKNNIKSSNILELLCKGNFISTQAILARKEIFDDIIFDESLPRFQDYDLVLRIAFKYKISFTDEVLVDLYRQDDSISNNTEKLKKAYSIMIKKNYNLTEFQQNLFDDTMFCWATDYKYSELDYKYNLLKADFESLKRSYEETTRLCSDVTNEYNKIINSKRWIYLNKILRFIGK